MDIIMTSGMLEFITLLLPWFKIMGDTPILIFVDGGGAVRFCQKLMISFGGKAVINNWMMQEFLLIYGTRKLLRFLTCRFW